MWQRQLEGQWQEEFDRSITTTDDMDNEENE